MTQLAFESVISTSVCVFNLHSIQHYDVHGANRAPADQSKNEDAYNYCNKNEDEINEPTKEMPEKFDVVKETEHVLEQLHQEVLTHAAL